jgi:hypothetical protein
MSRRGIHPLLMGLDKPEEPADDATPNTQDIDKVETSGLESAQRKRFLRSEQDASDRQD